MRRLLIAFLLFLCGCAAQSDPFQTFYSPTADGNAARATSKVVPSVLFYDPPTMQERDQELLALSKDYYAIGISNFQSIWGAPHREEAARTGQKLGADLVAYWMRPLGTQLMSVPHMIFEPGQSFTTETSGYVGNTYGSFSSYGYSPGTLHTQYTTEQVGQYQHFVIYLVKRK